MTLLLYILSILILKKSNNLMKSGSLEPLLHDDNLTSNTHRAAIAKKVSRNAGIFFRARHMFSTNTMQTLYSI